MLNNMRTYAQAHSLQLFVSALAIAALCAGVIDPAVAGMGLLVLDTDAVDFKALRETTEKALKAIGDQVREIGEQARAEAKKVGDMSAATKEKADETLLKQGELVARLQEVEQKLDRRGAEAAQGPKSIGQQLVEDENFKAYIKAGNFRKGFNFPCAAVVTLSSQPAVAGDGIEPDRQGGLVFPPQRRMTVRDLITPGKTNSNLITYVKETGFQNLAAVVSELAAKPKSDITLDLISSPVTKIATYVKASTEIIADVPMLQSYLDGRLRYMLAFVEETQLLKGSGVGLNLNGIYTQATAYSAPIAVPAPTKIDQLRLAMLQAGIAEFPPTGIVLHPSDWAAIELKKDTQGRYIIGDPKSLLQPTLWGLPVVATQAMTVDTALVGAFRLGAQVFDRLQANVQIATENEDDFIKNIVTILAEERLGLAVYRPEAFIKIADLPGS